MFENQKPLRTKIQSAVKRRGFSGLRRHINLVVLWLLCSTSVTHADKPASEGKEYINAGLSVRYSFKLTIDKKADLCAHMGQVFNQKFSRLWDRDALLPGDSYYSENSKYSFPKLPKVAHDNRTTFDISLSKQPTSPEFESVRWQEGHVFGDASNLGIPEYERTLPILVAYFDFDNDGHEDTVVKYGFSQGYSYMRYGRGGGLLDEHLAVWLGERRSPPKFAELFKIPRSSGSGSPIWLDGTYMRPFILDGHVYMAEYSMTFDDVEGQAQGAVREGMSIVDYRLGNDRNPYTKIPVFTGTSICQYDMVQKP